MPAAVTALGPEVDQPVGGLDHVQVVLTTVLPWSRRRCSTPAAARTSMEMQAGGRFVEDVQGLAGVAFGQLADSLTRCASPPDSVVALWPSLM